MELGIPVCIALNMIDVAETRGVKIDAAKLCALLGVPVVPTIARSGKGKGELMGSAAALIQAGKASQPLAISYGSDVDRMLDELTPKIEANGFLAGRYPARWVALKYLESDEQIRRLGRQADPKLGAELEAAASRLSSHLQDTADTYPEMVIADHRYGFIKSVLKQGVVDYQQDLSRLFLSDRIDKVLTQRFLGPVIMAAVVWALYHFTFNLSETPVAWVEGFFEWLGGQVESRMADGLLKSLLKSGVIDGVGGVLGFTPLIMFMFFGISLIEDSGYLARVAYMLDRVFRIFGLHGSSVMAFIVSGGIAGGCAVPGVMAARTLKSPRERLATLLTAPFMNCGAKLPVFALLVAAFFSSHEALMMVLITAVAWIGALLAAKLLRITVIKGASTPFVMELPPYRLPTFKGLLIHTWERTWQYIKKAGTVILSISILLWVLMTFPQLPDATVARFEEQRAAELASASEAVAQEVESAEEDAELSADAQALKERLLAIDGQKAEAGLRHSIAGRMGTALESITRLAGFDWRTNIALVGGFAAKEVVVSTLGTAYSLGEVDPEESGPLSEKLAETPGWSALTAMSLIVFTIFYAPCFVAVVCISREAGSWKWGAFSIVFNTLIAFLVAVLVFQVGSALGF
jgi:ferrous iron transport protein B